jgi:signal transduction histidine kinase
MLKMLGGKIWVESEGERFNIYFTIPYQTDAENKMVLIRYIVWKN